MLGCIGWKKGCTLWHVTCEFRAWREVSPRPSIRFCRRAQRNDEASATTNTLVAKVFWDQPMKSAVSSPGHTEVATGDSFFCAQNSKGFESSQLFCMNVHEATLWRVCVSIIFGCRQYPVGIGRVSAQRSCQCGLSHVLVILC